VSGERNRQVSVERNRQVSGESPLSGESRRAAKAALDFYRGNKKVHSMNAWVIWMF
jgi:hypothetical protein